jgi:hypothetical protein
MGLYLAHFQSAQREPYMLWWQRGVQRSCSAKIGARLSKEEVVAPQKVMRRSHFVS